MPNIIDADYFNQQMTTLGLKASFTPLPDALDVLIADASLWVENYCDRVFAQTSVVDELRGQGRNRLLLDQFPVVAVTSIQFDADSGTPSAIDVSKIRVLNGGILEWKNPLNGPFRSDGMYTVTYDAGYAVVPSIIKRATALKVADLMRPQYQGPSDREVNMVSDIEEKVIDLLEFYRRERLG